MTDQDLKNKIEKNGCYLLGQIPLNIEEHNDIMSYAKNIIRLEEKYLVEGPDLRLATALVLVAISDYQDGKYWEVLKNRFDLEELSIQKQGILGKIFLNTLSEYNLLELNKNSNGAMRYVENIKAHAFVTNNYMQGFYDFLYDYYENNLFRDISNGVEETLQDLSDFIKTTMNQNNDIIYSGSDNNGKTKKSYKLLKSTREIIAQCDGNILYQLLYPSLKIIDDNFYDDILPDDNSGRFGQIYKEWYANRIEKNENKARLLNKRRFYSHKPYIMINTNKYVRSPFTLIIPKRRYRPTECNGNVKVTIIINGIARPPKYLEVSTNMGTYISEEYRYQLDYPFDDIKVIIESLENNETIIESKNYAIFNNNFIKTARFEKGTNYLLVKPNTLIEFSDESMVIDIEKNEEWIQYTLNISEDSICYINNKPLTIIGEFSKEPIFEYEISYFSAYNEKLQRITAARMHPLISLELDKNKKLGTTIQINNKNYSLDNAGITIYDSPINKNEIIISANLNDFAELVNGYYKIELNIPGENNKLITEYLLLNNVNFLFDKRRYINEIDANVTLKTNGMNISIIDNECSLTYENDYRNSYYYRFKLSSKYRTISARLFSDNKIFYLKVPVKMLLYGFSSDNLKYGKVEEIWYSNLKELVYIQFPEVEKLGIYSGKNLESVIWGEKIDENLYRINITPKIEEIKNSTRQREYLNIRYYDNGDRWINLFSVAKSVKINPYFEFEFYNDIPCFNVEFKSFKGIKVRYTIKKSENREIILNHKELKNGINYLPEIERNIYYDIFPCIEECDEFGFNNKIITMPSRKGQGIISYNKMGIFNNMDFPNGKIDIDSIIYENNTLKISKLYKYIIDLKEYNSERKEYIGELSEIEYKYNVVDGKTLLNIKEDRILGNVKLKNVEKTNTGDILFKLDNYSENDEEWYDLFYIKDNYRLVENDNEILDKITIDKVIELIDEDTTFITKTTK